MGGSVSLSPASRRELCDLCLSRVWDVGLESGRHLSLPWAVLVMKTMHIKAAVALTSGFRQLQGNGSDCLEDPWPETMQMSASSAGAQGRGTPENHREDTVPNATKWPPLPSRRAGGRHCGVKWV